MGLVSGAYVRCRNSKKPKKIARLRTDKGAAIDQSKVAAPGLYSIERCMKPKYRLPITSGQGKGSKGQKERKCRTYIESPMMLFSLRPACFSQFVPCSHRRFGSVRHI